MFRNILFIAITIFYSLSSRGQFVKSRAIDAQIGVGVSSPSNGGENVANGGFFVQGEYVLTVKTWFDLKPYLGLVITNSDGRDLNNNPTVFRATTKAALVGGKGRIRAPIPYIAPYIELGVGLSIGSFDTFTEFTNIQKNGVVAHIPISFGLELGRNNNVDLGFSVYIQPNVDQGVGAFAIGLSIPLKNKNL